jgi:hypothetical protein
VTVDLSAQTPVLSVTHHPLGKPGGPGLFRVQGLQLPAYIQNIAAVLQRNGHSESQAIQLAIGACQRWARGGGNVSPEVRAAAAKAIAEWSAAKATAHSHANDGTEAVELAFDEALHPRVSAGATGGGRFTAGQQQDQGKQQPKKRRRGKRKMHGAPPMRPPSGPNAPAKPPLVGRAAQAHNLRTRATALRTQADGLDAKADALAKAHPSSAAASRAAKAKAGAPARKRNLPVRHTTKHAGSKKNRGPSVASRVTNLRTMAKALRTRAAILDHRAGTLSMAGEGPAVDLAGAVTCTTPAVASGDGPRVTTMGGTKAVAVYRKLRAKGMKHEQALALAKRAAAMKAKAAA